MICLILLFPVITSCQTAPKNEPAKYVLPQEPKRPKLDISSSDLQGLNDDNKKKIVASYAELVGTVNQWELWAAEVEKITDGKPMEIEE